MLITARRLLLIATAVALSALGGSTALLAAKPKPAAAAKAGPIVETHIHVYQVTRPGGVPWPPAANKVLYRDVLPADYKALASKQGVVAAGIMEASPLFEDNLKIADLIAHDKFFTFYVA